MKLYPTLTIDWRRPRGLVCRDDKYTVRKSAMDNVHVINNQSVLAEKLFPDDDCDKQEKKDNDGSSYYTLLIHPGSNSENGN